MFRRATLMTDMSASGFVNVIQIWRGLNALMTHLGWSKLLSTYISLRLQFDARSRAVDDAREIDVWPTLPSCAQPSYESLANIATVETYSNVVVGMHGEGFVKIIQLR